MVRGIVFMFIVGTAISTAVPSSVSAERSAVEGRSHSQLAPDKTERMKRPAPILLAQNVEAQAPPVRPSGEEQGMAVREFLVEGNTLMAPERVREIVGKYQGPNKSFRDLEKAKQDLEAAYHAMGYVSVLVTLPEQTIENGTVRLEVIEARLGSIKVSNNRYYSQWNIRSKLPSLKVGELLYEPALVKDLDALNANPDLKVAPTLKPGSEPGLINVELKTTDRLPFHGRVQADNQGPLFTPRNRVTLEGQYTNLFDKDHILTVTTVQTPEDIGAVQSYGVSYVAPIKWPDHLLSVYASKSLFTASLPVANLPLGGSSINIVGNATAAGVRYFFPVFPKASGSHKLSVGADFLRLEKTEAIFPGFLGSAVVLSPIQYTPLSMGYAGLLSDQWGVTQFGATVRGYCCGIIPGGRKTDFAGDPNDPFNKPGSRAGSSGSFAVVRGNLDRHHTLPYGFDLHLRADGQWASEPLIPAEAYFAGGYETVRGYINFEALGDHAARGRAELTTPELIPIPVDYFWQRRRSTEWAIGWKLAAFYDAANLWVQEPLPGQQEQFRLESVGWGLRVAMPKKVGEIRIDQGYALQNLNVTKRGDSFVHFVVSAGF
jgi:hemolysin activation/secretion protein